jgi:coenzyme F420-reducing hydrogenase delta subunit
MRRRLAILRKLLEFVGIEPERLQVSWVSAAEPQKFVDVVSKVVEDVKRLGPLKQLRAETEMQLVSKKKLEIEA